MPLDLTNATAGKLSLACGAGVFFLKKTRKYKDRGRHLESNGAMENLGWRGGRALPLFQFQRSRW